MRVRSALVLMGLLLAATSQLNAQDYRYAAASVRLRADARADSRVLITLARGARVEVRACAVEWCWVEYGNRSGYVAERFLTRAGPRVVAQRGRMYASAKGSVVPAPLFGFTGPPKGATARCRDGSYSFSQSRSGTCSNHGGVAKWL
jgi:uncharacterized protein YraI